MVSVRLGWVVYVSWGFGNAREDIRDGATVVGGDVKKDPSSSVSRKSVRTENSLPRVSG